MRADDHAASHRAVLGKLSLPDDVQVPLAVVLAAGRDGLRFRLLVLWLVLLLRGFLFGHGDRCFLRTFLLMRLRLGALTTPRQGKRRYLGGGRQASRAFLLAASSPLAIQITARSRG